MVEGKMKNGETNECLGEDDGGRLCAQKPNLYIESENCENESISFLVSVFMHSSFSESQKESHKLNLYFSFFLQNQTL